VDRSAGTIFAAHEVGSLDHGVDLLLGDVALNHAEPDGARLALRSWHHRECRRLKCRSNSRPLPEE
jgi:hypothetical protein